MKSLPYFRILAGLAMTAAMTTTGPLTESLVAQGTTSSRSLTDTVPNDPGVTVGTLPNGLRYYIRANKKPEKRVELRLVVKAGSLMEDEKQLGLAHYAEHMAFNGTKHFKKNELIEYLQSIGVRFGADLNAMTTFDQTVYMLPVPTDTLAQVKQALQILEDWAHNITFDPKDFADERGVVIGEWRSRLGVGSRLSDKQLPVLFKGSRYADRLPIGTKASLDNAKVEDIVRFYKTWYRPDLMAVIAVGDIDPKQMEAMIREQFSKIPAAQGPAPKPTYPVPPQPGTAVLVATDPEMPQTQVSVTYKRPAFEQGTMAAYRGSLRRGLFSGLINQRIGEILQEPNAPFLSAGIGFGGLSEDVSTAELSVTVGDNQTQRGFEALLTEIARVTQHGFTQTELDRAKKNYLASLENYYQNRNDLPSGSFIDDYISHFLQGVPYPSLDTYIGVLRELIGSVTLEDIKQEAAFLNQTDNRILTVVQPDKQGLQQPDTTALLTAFTRIAAQPVTAYVDKVETASAAGLLDALPTPGKIVSEKKDPDTDVTEWTLSNGAVVLLKPTKFRASEILFAGVSPGGMSLVPDSEYPSAVFGDLVGTGGWGRYSLASLSRQLSGKIVNLGSSIGGITENIGGNTTWKDLESMLQLLHLTMSAPRYDSNAIKAVLQRSKVGLANRSASPEAVFSDTVSVTMSQGSKRSPLVSVALMDQVQPERVFKIYKERFADASDFVFMFVGAFNPDSLRPYVERYIASLPALNRKDTPRDLPELHGPPGIVRKTVRAGREDKSVTVLQFPGSREKFTRQDANDLSVMTDILQNRLTKRLREDLGGTYGVSVGASQTPKPISRYTIGVQFVAEPARREELLAAVFAAIDSLKRVPPTAEELHRVVEPALREREKARRTNGYWLGLADFRMRGRPYKEALDDTILTGTTPDRVMKAAQNYINLKNYQEFNLVPEQVPAATAAK